MPLEWFECCGLERPGYRHSRTRLSVHRSDEMTDPEWSSARAAFFERFPRASEVRVTGVLTIPTALIPHGVDPVFVPGDRLTLCLLGQRKRTTVKIVAVQMPLFGDGEQASYLLADGGEVFWNSKTDCWIVKQDGEFEVVAAARLPPRRPKHPSRKLAAG